MAKTTTTKNGSAAADKKATKFMLASTEQKNVFIHYSTRTSDKDHAYRLKEGSKEAKIFTQKQLDEYLETLPENNGLQIIDVE